MSPSQPRCLVILAGGKSRRMGRDKAELVFDGQRLIDRAIERFSPHAGHIILSAENDLGTGYNHIPDHPDEPEGPVGAIFSITDKIRQITPEATGFVTIPVDAPFAQEKLIERLSGSRSCAIAESPKRLHPTFAYWDCDTVNNIRDNYRAETNAPSLHWLARQCDAAAIAWPDEQSFMNINTPEDLAAAEAHIKRTDARE